MKKILLAAFVFFSLLGVTTIIRAQTAPTVSAGSAQAITLPTNSVTLTGVASTPNGSITSYAWSKISGGSASIVSPNTISTTVNGLTQGVYTFRLTVMDSANISVFADVAVTVNPAPASLLPVVNAGSAQSIILPVNSVTLSGSATASLGRTIASYNWVQTSGPLTSVIANPTSLTTVVNNLNVAGDYVFTLTAVDNTSASATGSVSIKVNSQVVPMPVKNKMKLEINPNGNVNLQGELLSNVGGVLTTKVWGITFTINTNTARVNGLQQDISKFAVGDLIKVNGRMDSLATTPTINAKLVRNVSYTFVQNYKEKKYDDDRDGKRDDDKKFFSNSGKGNEKNGKGKDR